MTEIVTKSDAPGEGKRTQPTVPFDSALPVSRGYESAGEPGAGDFSPSLLLHGLRRWGKLVIPLALLLAVGAAAGVYTTFEPTYEAAAWLRFSEATSYLAYSSSGEVSREFDVVQTHIELINSPVVLGAAANRLRPEVFPASTSEDQVLHKLAKKLDVSRLGRSELLKISFESRDAAAAAQVVNSVVESYFDFLGVADSGRTQRVIELLEEERATREEGIAQLRKEIGELMKQSPGLDLLTGNPLMEAQGQNSLAELQTQLATLEGEQEVLRARIRALKETLDSASFPVPEGRLARAVEEQPEIQRLKAALAEKQTKLVEIETASARGSDDPFYRHLLRQVENDQEMLARVRDKLREQVAEDLKLTVIAEEKTELDDLELQFERNRALEKALRQRYEDEVGSMTEVGSGAVELHAKRSELSRAEEVLNTITTRLTRLRTEQRAPGKVMLLKAAAVPSEPLVGFPLKRIALASLAAFFLPLGLVFVGELLAARVNTAEDLARRATVPILAETPRLPVARRLLPSIRERRFRRDLEAFEEAVDGVSALILAADMFRDMRVLAITSATLHEGKTSIAVQLAASIARATGEETLLVDGDLRSPDIHTIMRVAAAPGLAEVLAGDCTAEEAVVSWKSCLSILPAGRLSASPRGLLREDKLRSLLDLLRARFRHVVIDGPPLLAASEAMTFAKTVDGCLLCVMRDVSSHRQVELTCRRLLAAGVTPAGLVFNGVSPKRYGSRYGSYRYARRPARRA